MRKELVLIAVMLLVSAAVSGQTSKRKSNHYVIKPDPQYACENRPGAGSNLTQISGGILNTKATSLPKPEYPIDARAGRAAGVVSVQVLISEEGNVIAASAVSGHPLLRAPAVAAARQAKFSATRLSGRPIKVSGILTYNFVVPKRRG